MKGENVHTDACEAARAGHTIEDKDEWGVVIDLRPDPYPSMGKLGPLEREAVLLCPHPHHDVVRLFWELTR